MSRSSRITTDKSDLFKVQGAGYMYIQRWIQSNRQIRPMEKDKPELIGVQGAGYMYICRDRDIEYGQTRPIWGSRGRVYDLFGVQGAGYMYMHR